LLEYDQYIVTILPLAKKYFPLPTALSEGSYAHSGKGFFPRLGTPADGGLDADAGFPGDAGLAGEYGFAEPYGLAEVWGLAAP